MAAAYEHDIQVRGEYVYINKHCIKFDSEEQATEFLLKLIVEKGFLDR